jgi:4-hydroxybenzoyl-CoA reductase subunit beta
MLRLPPFRYHRPDSLDEARELLDRHGDEARLIAGGTDLIPNMKHGLFSPAHLVSLRGLDELRGAVENDGWIEIGAAETLADVASHPIVRLQLPSLAKAAGLVAGPQIRNSATIGGNLCLDTRCTYYNQTEFWRGALGYCLKKDGSVCHVTRVGKKCVAAHSADTPPVLMVLGAELELLGPQGTRTISVADFFVADGIWNTVREKGEILTRIRIPTRGKEFSTAYRKLRIRGSIDFPLLSVAVGARRDEGGSLQEIKGVVTGLGARPRVLTGWEELAVGSRPDAELVSALAERAHAQCHPLENMIVDPEWRRAMVRVETARALSEVLGLSGGTA